MPSKTRRSAVRNLFKSKSKSKSKASKSKGSKASKNTRRNALKHSTVAGLMYKTGAMTNRW